MATADDVRKTIEAMIENLTPARAQEIAKGFTDPGAAKDQVAKAAADLLEWSQRNRDRMRDVIRREMSEQLKGVGLATQADLDALKKRVRDLERAAGMTASGRSKSRKKTAARSPAKSSPKSSAKASSAGSNSTGSSVRVSSPSS